jgi:phosphoglycolate phosphatase
MIGPFALAVLDMAGTTVRDDGAVDAAFTEALQAVGVAPGSVRNQSAHAYVLETMGQSKSEVFAALLDPDDAAVATATFAQAYEAIVAGGSITAIPGAVEVFDELRARGVQVCLTTGFAPSTRDALIATLGWADRIDLALSPADVGRGRPEPDLIFGAMERLGVSDPEAVAVVGDTTSDLQAGTRAGVKAVIGVLTGAHDRRTLESVPHTALLEDITQLIDLLSDVD